MSGPNQAVEDPVTLIVRRRIKPGREADYESWLTGISREARQFDGHLGVSVIRPLDPAHPEYVLVFRFDRYSNLRKWEESDT